MPAAALLERPHTLVSATRVHVEPAKRSRAGILGDLVDHEVVWLEPEVVGQSGHVPAGSMMWGAQGYGAGHDETVLQLGQPERHTRLSSAPQKLEQLFAVP